MRLIKKNCIIYCIIENLHSSNTRTKRRYNKNKQKKKKNKRKWNRYEKKIRAQYKNGERKRKKVN